MRPACDACRPGRLGCPEIVRRGQAGVLLLALMLSACGAATSGTSDDATISTRVKIALLNDPQLGPERLDARTFQGVVTLSGTVKSAAEEQQAIAVARKIRGVKDVMSELKIGSMAAFRLKAEATEAKAVRLKAESTERSTGAFRLKAEST